MLLGTVAFIVLFGIFAVSSTFSLRPDSAHAATSDSQASLTLDTVLDISAPSTITMSCTPGSTDATSQLCTSNATVSVSTNNVTGYTLQMNTTSGSSNSLTNTGINPNATIPTLSQAYSSANFPVNYWGYTGGLDKSSETGGYNCATNYCPILAYESTSSNYAPNHTIKVTDAPANNSSTTLTFGAKVNTTKPSGTYTTSITFTAVANYVPPTTMQDFDADACARATVDQPFTLTDTRDGTSYTVAKLQDGNCWMTQNLALGSSSPTVLTQADSDVGPSGFTLPASDIEGGWTGSFDDPGFFDYAGNYDDSTTKYGNYYNWNAATAGSGTSAIESGDTEYSICPKNWRLPPANSATSEQYNMIRHYINSGTFNNSDPDRVYWTGVTTTDFTSSPVSLVFPGYYAIGLGNQGVDGCWWSSTASNSNDAYSLSADSYGDVTPRTNNSRILYNSVRCLANKPV